MQSRSNRIIILKAPKEQRQWNMRYKRILVPAAGALLGNIFAPGVGGMLVGGLAGAVLAASSDGGKAMTRIPVFYSFHFDNDVMRVQQIRNIGSIEGNTPTTPNEWERLKRNGDAAVMDWIEENMKYKRCVVVLIGSDTASRPWVKYEIEQAWNKGKALLGIYIHNIRCPRTGTCRKGRNPFDDFQFEDGSKLSSVVSCYDPDSNQAYRDISNGIISWINSAIENKKN